MPARTPLAAALLLVAGLTGCASSPGTVPPSGVDQLVVPTPTPDPGDFVDVVDNPWFPLEPGSRQRWTIDGEPEGGLRVEVLAGPRTAGVATTAVRTTATLDPAGGGGWSADLGTDYYGQDRDGNVWWFGHEGEWRAGVDGAEAGLVVPARPRTGDGYRMAFLAGVVEDRAEVLAAGADLLEIERIPEDGARSVTHYERGLGPVRVETSDGVAERISDDPVSR